LKTFFLFFAIGCFALFTSLNSFSPDKNALVHDVLKQTNQFRKSHHLNKLIIRKELNEIAQKHSENMARKRVAFGHSGFAKRNALAKRKFIPFIVLQKMWLTALLPEEK